MNRKQRRAAQKAEPAQRCVSCGRPIPRKAVAYWYFDKATGALYGCHHDAACLLKMDAGMKSAMTWGAWVRYRLTKKWRGSKRVLRTFASRWTSERWQRNKVQL